MKVALTGGGTLGHVIPTLAVAEAIRGRCEGASFFYIGSRKENERKVVEEEGIPFYPVSTGKLRRYFSLKNLTDVFRLAFGFFSSIRILRREKPDVLFSKGGYVSVPVVLAAHFLGIPSVTHESDRSLGLANRINARFCRAVCLGFDTGAGGKYIYTGNPVRMDILEARNDPSKGRYILVLGGSQGAKSLNELIYEDLDRLLELAPVIHQAGKYGDFTLVRDGYKQVEFISDELPSLMRNASLVISRAGANAVTELLASESVMILVPLSVSASRGDQLENASFLESEGAALVAGNAQELIAKAEKAFSDEALRQSLREKGRVLWRRDAAGHIAEIVIKCAGE